MKKVYLHNHPEFKNLIRVLSEEMSIVADLIEKDYWIMHVLYGLKKGGYEFELKGGTSLSKGYKIIDRFSEDIDIHIHPPVDLELNLNPNNTKPAILEKREQFYDKLADEINIDGLLKIERDREFDNKRSYLSGGIRLFFENYFPASEGVKEGILLEAGFDIVTPNNKITISSWAYDKAILKIQSAILDNRAIDVHCYDTGYTLVEKLQTITTKFRNEQETGIKRKNLLRQYYDVAMLLQNESVKHFIGTSAYLKHKELRFSQTDLAIPISNNQAFLLSDDTLRSEFKKRYQETKGLYYMGQIEFEKLLDIIHHNIDKL
jgi:hypothetical protein